ncbi:MAG: hypothetical protein ABIJ92_03140 [Candidatus Aenigmatarchaeota archaeon]
MDILRHLLGWDWKIRKLRKKWDRLREKSLKKDGQLKKTLLEKLDLIEAAVRTLEERKLVRYERSRLVREVQMSLASIKVMLKSEYIPPTQAIVQKKPPQNPQQQVKR